MEAWVFLVSTEFVLSTLSCLDLPQNHLQRTPASPASVRLPAHHHSEQWVLQCKRCPLVEEQQSCLSLGDLLCFHSFTLPEEPVHGGSQQTASPPGGLLHALVPLLLAAEPPPGLLPAGGLQQHHPVSVRWWERRHGLIGLQVTAFAQITIWTLLWQVTSTWCTPSSVSETFSTSWPTCRPTRRLFRGPCKRRRGRESLGRTLWRMSPWRAPDLLYPPSPAHSKPA